eukprot:2600223-Pyramimonas_sp.AAC.1
MVTKQGACLFPTNQSHVSPTSGALLLQMLQSRGQATGGSHGRYATNAIMLQTLRYGIFFGARAPIGRPADPRSSPPGAFYFAGVFSSCPFVFSSSVRLLAFGSCVYLASSTTG